ncbi:MAG: alpha/beta hydrolase [Mariniphaga sp.]|nr:alpha/beta hydrolase [Mariniphaga sp.]
MGENSFLLFGLLMLFCTSTYSQTVFPEKQEFVYKTVDGHNIKANIFLPNYIGFHPVLIYFHGGGFIFGNRDEGLEKIIKDKFLAANYAVISADYRLAPETKLDEILNDVSDVVAWIRKNGLSEFKIDTNKIAVVGGSAGGYLALSTGFKKEKAPNAIIAISSPTGFSTANIKMGDLSILNQPGPYDIVTDSIVSYGDYDRRMTLWRFLGRNNLALYEIFGFDPSRNNDKLEKFRLTTNIDSSYPPTLLIHAKNDRLVDLQEAKNFYEFLNKKEITTELYIVENGHSSELINQYPEAVDKMISFLNSQLK